MVTPAKQSTFFVKLSKYVFCFYSTGCPDYHFKCGSGECLGGYFVCDGGQNKDCRDGSDEISCGECKLSCLSLYVPTCLCV